MTGRATCASESICTDKRGEVTAFLALIFILLISFLGAIMESASIQIAKNYRRADVNRAMESVFAEYQQELLEEFDLFALEGGYETGSYSERNITERLAYYGAADMRHKVLRIQFLTDSGGRAFMEQVSSYIEHKYGLDSLKSMLGMTQVWKDQEEASNTYQEEEKRADESLENLLEEHEGELPLENNPLQNISQVKKSSLTDIVMPKDKKVSEKQADTKEFVSVRNRNEGYGTFTDVAEESTVSALALGEYLLEHFSSAAAKGEEQDKILGGVLDYELEYILGGKESDRENLDTVLKKLLLFRFAPNYGYVLSDGEKRAEAEGMALALCTALAVPAITEAVTLVLLLAWAFGESIMDIRSLMAGNRVPAIKNKESWQLALSGLLTLGTEEDKGEGKDTEGGLSYEEYLRILLFLADKEKVSMRSLDLIEKKIQLKAGAGWFKADYCAVKMETESVCSLRRGITYEFKTYFGYR